MRCWCHRSIVSGVAIAAPGAMPHVPSGVHELRSQPRSDATKRCSGITRRVDVTPGAVFGHNGIAVRAFAYPRARHRTMPPACLGRVDIWRLLGTNPIVERYRVRSVDAMCPPCAAPGSAGILPFPCCRAACASSSRFSSLPGRAGTSACRDTTANPGSTGRGSW
jgi:hypothetical protein